MAQLVLLQNVPIAHLGGPPKDPRCGDKANNLFACQLELET